MQADCGATVSVVSSATTSKQQLPTASAAPAAAPPTSGGVEAGTTSGDMQPTPTTTGEALPVFDLSAWLSCASAAAVATPAEQQPQQEQPQEPQQEQLAAQCRALARCLQATGCLVVRDPRVASSDNGAFLDLMERYFGRDPACKAADARPELCYQVGATPAGVETPRCVAEPEACRAAVEALAPEHRPHLPTGPDAKERFFWRVGARPAAGETAFPELNAAPVVPAGLPQWVELMDSFGGKLMDAVRTVCEMLDVGFGLPTGTLTSLMERGPHLLAPTGSDLTAHNDVDVILSGFHYDLNLLTIHGRSRYPGLFVWLRDGRRLPVSIPDGCLLLQAGKQLEHLTAGAVRAGMHEVVVTEATVEAARAAAAAGRSTWRVSSTLFAHCASDAELRPLGPFAALVEGDAEAAARYAPIKAGAQVAAELAAIKLKR